MPFWKVTLGIECGLLAILVLWYLVSDDDAEQRDLIAVLFWVAVIVSSVFDLVALVVRWLF